MSSERIIVALSGGVDSAVAALSLVEAGCAVECLHMTNWEDDGYCDSAADARDAREVCRHLGVPLHRVNFSAEYRERVFADFLAEYRAGRTPNPDVLCNREIKFGVLLDYARRLGAARLATGHYARIAHGPAGVALLRGADSAKDQSYFLHQLAAAQLEHALFPLGDLDKPEVRRRAHAAGLPVAAKRDSTGICFIGERPFREFLGRYVEAEPGPIRTLDGETLGAHRGLPYYTLGQRQGLEIGGRRGTAGEPWYVAGKSARDNALLVVQGHDHPALLQRRLTTERMHWIGPPPPAFAAGDSFACTAKTRYRQADVPCTVRPLGDARVEVEFCAPQRAVTPGQFVVLYDAERCLGGGVIAAAAAGSRVEAVRARVQAH